MLYFKKYFSYLLILTCVLGICSSSVSADVTGSIKLDGSTTSAIIAPSDPSTTVIFIGTSKGNISLPFAYSVQAPTGSKVKITFSSNKTRAAASSSRKKILRTSPFQTSALQTKAATSNEDVCSTVSDSDFALIIQYLKLIYPNKTWDRESACTWLQQKDPGGGSGGTEGGSNPSAPAPTTTDPGQYGELHGVGLFRKDACGKSSDQYTVRIEVDMSSIDRSQYSDQGLQVIAQAKVYPYKGSRAATIKPVSEGWTAPSPLVLMSSLGGNQVIELNIWNGGKIRSTKKLPVEDYAYYRGQVLTRTRISSVLKGGKGTFDIYNDNTGYGVCFSLVKRRQSVNGYQGGS